MKGTESSRKARDTFSHRLILPRFHGSLHLPSPALYPLSLFFSFSFSLPLSLSLSLSLSLCLSLSLSRSHFPSTSAYSLFRFPPPNVVALIYIFKQRSGSIAPNFLKGNPSENWVLWNRPSLENGAVRQHQIFSKETLPKIWCYRTALACCYLVGWEVGVCGPRAGGLGASLEATAGLGWGVVWGGNHLYFDV